MSVDLLNGDTQDTQVQKSTPGTVGRLGGRWSADFVVLGDRL